MGTAYGYEPLYPKEKTDVYKRQLYTIIILGNKINFHLIQFANINIISSTNQFQVNHVFQNMTYICISSTSKKNITQTNIYYVVFFQSL